LASSVVAVVSQCLLRTTDEKRVAAYEIMIRTDGIAAKIRENKTFQITSDIETGASRGMRTLDADLLALFNQGIIPEEEVFNYAQDAEMMRQRIKGGAAR
jgi:twitching motility protein PilT